MPAGRPSKLTPELIQAARNYIDKDKWKDAGHVIPSVMGLIEVLNTVNSTFYNWIGNKDLPGSKELMEVLETIKEKQHRLLIEKGLMNDWNSNIVKLVLGKHGYHDKQDIKQDVSLSLSEMSEEQLDAKIKEKLDKLK